MPTAITLFGIADGTDPVVFVYGFSHLVRGAGAYPAPTLPSSAAANSIWRTPIGDVEGLHLVTWDTIFDDSVTDAILRELESGRFSIPRECPIEPGCSITGQPFGPVIVIRSYLALAG
jgi:hypothetical protein